MIVPCPPKNVVSDSILPAGTEVTVMNLHDDPMVVLLVASPPPAGDPEIDQDLDESVGADRELNGQGD